MPARDPNRPTDERYTPTWVFDLAVTVMGAIDLDPCADPRKRVPAARHITKDEDGLSQAWSGRVYMNPPFSRTTDWIKHLCVYVASGAVTEAIILVPVMTLGSKSSRLLMRGTASCFALMDRSIQFLDSNYRNMDHKSPFPFALVYVGDNSNRFLEITDPIGVGCVLKRPHPQHQQSLCQYCGKSFIAKRSTAKFCSTTCRVEAHRKKKVK